MDEVQTQIDSAYSQHNDSNFNKKSKKKKRKRHTPDPVPDTDPSANNLSDDEVKVVAVRNKDEIIDLCGDLDDEVVPGDITKKKKKEKKNKLSKTSDRDTYNVPQIEGGVYDLVKIKMESIDDTLSQRKAKGHLAKASTIEEEFPSFVEVQEEPVGDSLKKKKKKKGKPANESLFEERFDSLIKVKEEPADDMPSQKKKKKRNYSDFVNVKEEPLDECLLQKKKKKKKESVGDSSAGGVVDTPVKIKEEPVEETCSRKKRKRESSVSDNRLSDPLVNQHTSVNKVNDAWTNKWSNNTNINRKTPMNQNHMFHPNYKPIPPQDVSEWQQMVFRFDNHPTVRHYVPRKLMAMNGINQQLGEVDEVQLKIPYIVFKGSSLDAILGYGYNR